jgi:predicted phosphodiesterase
VASAGPGRACPLSYRYSPAALAHGEAFATDTLWVAGGLYGNPFALRTLLELYERESGPKALVFNGDFHWFDVQDSSFLEIESLVEKFIAVRGNVETELAAPQEGAGCGCGYPEWVDDGTVARSNRILEKLRNTAGLFPGALRRLADLPMHLVARVGGERVAVVHGDAESLAGWGFSQECLATRAGRAAATRCLREAGVSVFASSHTCLPVLQALDGGVLANNGAAGMPNFRGTRFGLATRISIRPSEKELYREKTKNLFIEAIKLEYDHSAWERRFLEQWPTGSDAHASYYERIAHGPQYRLDQALRREAAAAA